MFVLYYVRFKTEKMLRTKFSCHLNNCQNTSNFKNKFKGALTFNFKNTLI